MPRRCDRTAEGVTVVALSITSARRPNPTRTLTRSVERTDAEFARRQQKKEILDGRNYLLIQPLGKTL